MLRTCSMKLKSTASRPPRRRPLPVSVRSESNAGKGKGKGDAASAGRSKSTSRQSLRARVSRVSRVGAATTTTTAPPKWAPPGRRLDRSTSIDFDPLEVLHPVDPAPDHLHPVLDIVKQRYNNRFSGAPKNSDGFKLGLVVEGGGMRGITSAGMLVELGRRGLRGIFDGVYGSSAGAINLTYFLSTDDTGADIYTDHIANSDFISLYRLLNNHNKGQKPVLDVSCLLDHVMESVLPLDWDRVVRSETPLKVAATALSTEEGEEGDTGRVRAEPVLLENFQSKEDLRESLRASACVPGIAGGPVRHRGKVLVDAMVHEPIPIWSAIDDGCTHVLTLSTKPKDEHKSRGTLAKRSFIRNWFMTPRYMSKQHYLDAEASGRGSLATEQWLSQDCPKGVSESFGAHVYTVFPEAQPIGSLCKKKEKLQEARNMGHDAIAELLDRILLDYPTSWGTFMGPELPSFE